MSTDSPKRITLTPGIGAVLVIAGGLFLARQFSPGSTATLANDRAEPAVLPASGNDRKLGMDSEDSDQGAANIAVQLPEPLQQRKMDESHLPDWFVPRSELDHLIASEDSSTPSGSSRYELESFETWTDQGPGDGALDSAKGTAMAMNRPASSPFSIEAEARSFEAPSIEAGARCGNAVSGIFGENLANKAADGKSLAWPGSSPSELALLPRDLKVEREPQQNLPGGLVSSVQAQKIGATLTREPRKKFFVYQPGMQPSSDPKRD